MTLSPDHESRDRWRSYLKLIVTKQSECQEKLDFFREKISADEIPEKQIRAVKQALESTDCGNPANNW